MRKKRMCLALQGGGAHGAFTWGVLDRLLQEETLEVEAVSGTSAGAMNGAVLVDALKRGGPRHARAQLERFWRSIASAGNGVFRPGRTPFACYGSERNFTARGSSVAQTAVAPPSTVSEVPVTKRASSEAR